MFRRDMSSKRGTSFPSGREGKQARLGRATNNRGVKRGKSGRRGKKRDVPWLSREGYGMREKRRTCVY